MNNFLKVSHDNGDITITFKDLVIVEANKSNPLVFIGSGIETVEMYRGNFKIDDYVEQRLALKHYDIESHEDYVLIKCSMNATSEALLNVKVLVDEKERLIIKPELLTEDINRFWIRLKADEDEKVYGCGEQPSHFNMRGKNFPIWTSEPGVGRNKNTYTTWQADVKDQAGGDYYTTYYAEPTYVSSRKYFIHVDSYAYADFNFRHETFHELHFWEVPEQIIIGIEDNYKAILTDLTDLLGRQPMLPDWAFEGVIMGVQGGTERMLEKKKIMQDAGVALSGFFIQDWQGIRMTSFGKRLFWDWKWSSEVYPNLDKEIWKLKEEGLRVMGYINPYLCNDGEFYKEAKEKGYFALDDKGDVYLVDFGEFYCGIVDFTNPEAFTWYKELIKRELIDFGFDGWMADFGEYLPTDLVLHDGSDPMIMHNKWPALWAKCNYEAVEESGKLGEVVYFMRAGATGSQKYCTLMWAGDQSVIWELDDGIASVIPSILSTAMVGCGLNHSDLGGYTSLHGNTRDKELFMRWVELEAFGPFLRSHEGNRPTENFQIYDGDEESVNHFAKFTNLFKDLSPYIKDLVTLNHEQGIPVQRPLFMEYEHDLKTYDIQYQFMLGEDVLVAPVYDQGVDKWEVYLPEDSWVHLWSKEEYTGGTITVDAPLGQPPVFVKKGSNVLDLLSKY